MLVNTVSYIHREVLLTIILTKKIDGLQLRKDDPTFQSMVERNDWPNIYLI